MNVIKIQHKSINDLQSLIILESKIINHLWKLIGSPNKIAFLFDVRQDMIFSISVLEVKELSSGRTSKSYVPWVFSRMNIPYFSDICTTGAVLVALFHLGYRTKLCSELVTNLPSLITSPESQYSILWALHLFLYSLLIVNCMPYFPSFAIVIQRTSKA